LGNQFLGITASMAQQFKAGGGISVQAAGLPAAPAPLPTPTPLPEPDTPTAYVQVELLNLRAGPSTELAIVGTATRNVALRISGRDPAYPEWWQVRDGEQIAWVYASLVRAAGPLDQVGVVAADPAAVVSAAKRDQPMNHAPPMTDKPVLSRQP
jgi:hypothetical protein